MADYHNNADVEQQARNNALYQLLAGAAQRQTEANIQGMHGQQAAQQQQVAGQQAQDLATLKNTLGGQADQAKIDRDMQTVQQLKDMGYGNRSVKAGEINVAEPSPINNVMAQTRKDNLNRLLVKDVTGDYDKRTTGLKSGMQAAQSITNALDSGDIQTLGHIKANLPRLEGEKFKVTDAERQMMLQPTAQGSMERLSNWWKGDNAALSDTQKSAIRNIINQKMSNAQKDMDASGAEVRQRWGHRISGFGPDEQQDLNASLGASTKNVMDNIHQAPTPAAPTSKRDLLNQLRQSQGALPGQVPNKGGN